MIIIIYIIPKLKITAKLKGGFLMVKGVFLGGGAKSFPPESCEKNQSRAATSPKKRRSRAGEMIHTRKSAEV